MIPFAKQTVTLIRRTETTDNMGRHHASYSTATLNGCSWRQTSVLNRESENQIRSENIICKVPVGQAIPKAGDVLVFGSFEGTVRNAADLQSIIDRMHDSGGAFVAQQVVDNTKSDAPLPHYKAMG